MKVFFGTLLVVGAAALSPAHAVEIGSVARLQGRADARGDNGELRRLEQAQPVYDQDVIRTKSDGSLLLALSDGVRIAIGPDSRLEFIHYSGGDKPEALLQLVRGRIQLLVTRAFADQAFVVQTAEARIPVSGAELEISAEFARTRVLVLTGDMQLKSSRGRYDSIVLYPGEGAVIAAGQRPIPANFLSGEEGAAAARIRSDIASGGLLDLTSGGLQSGDPANTVPTIPSALPLPQQPNPP